VDVVTIRIVIGILGAVSVLSVVGIVLLATFGYECPPSLVSVASISTGALVGIVVTPRPPRYNADDE
jgi:hypothetical protein